MRVSGDFFVFEGFITIDNAKNHEWETEYLSLSDERKIISNLGIWFSNEFHQETK